MITPRSPLLPGGLAVVVLAALLHAGPAAAQGSSEQIFRIEYSKEAIPRGGWAVEGYVHNESPRYLVSGVRLKVEVLDGAAPSRASRSAGSTATSRRGARRTSRCRCPAAAPTIASTSSRSRRTPSTLPDQAGLRLTPHVPGRRRRRYRCSPSMTRSFAWLWMVARITTTPVVRPAELGHREHGRACPRRRPAEELRGLSRNAISASPITCAKVPAPAAVWIGTRSRARAGRGCFRGPGSTRGRSGSDGCRRRRSGTRGKRLGHRARRNVEASPRARSSK